MHDVAIFDEIFLALKPELAFGFRLSHTPEADEVIISHHLRPNKATHQVRVDLTRGLLRRRAAFRLPRADFIFTDREE